jgi:hypothetical protein
MKQISVPKTKKECDSLLKVIQGQLIDLFPRAVKRQRIKKTAYGILICYIDLTTDSYAPFAAILPESYRERCIANRELDILWAIAEAPAIDVPLPSQDHIVEKCNAAYEYLSSGDSKDEYQAILPFRKMIYRVCHALNAIDWSAYLPVTDDFTVMASDWSPGVCTRQDAAASVPIKKRKALLKKGYFFNPDAAARPEIPASSALKTISRQPKADQVHFWLAQLEAHYDGRDCETKMAKIGPKVIVGKLADLGTEGGEGLLHFVEAKARIPEWTSPTPPTERWKAGSKTEIFGAAAGGLARCLSTVPENETRLWKAFEESVKINRSVDHWGSAPAIIAFAIQDTFRVKGAWKYDYWVVRDFRNQLTSLKEIRQQRRKLGPQ